MFRKGEKEEKRKKKEEESVQCLGKERKKK